MGDQNAHVNLVGVVGGEEAQAIAVKKFVA
jgi:hypothetical protein